MIRQQVPDTAYVTSKGTGGEISVSKHSSISRLASRHVSRPRAPAPRVRVLICVVCVVASMRARAWSLVYTRRSRGSLAMAYLQHCGYCTTWPGYYSPIVSVAPAYTLNEAMSKLSTHRQDIRSWDSRRLQQSAKCVST